MLTDKEQKKAFKKVASAEPDKYYATKALKEEGFVRKQCKECQKHFWTLHKDQSVCGDPACSGGFNVVDKNPAKHKLSYADVWIKFSNLLKERGYTPINRYPVVARWNPTTYFTIASIAAFQPYVISGESEPPAKMLTIPQFCLRFGDIDNVGITGSHCTCFVMIGQHAFVTQSEWNQEKYFRDMLDFLTKTVGLPKEELTLHEDAWAGGGNFGPCMEFFSRGVELFNQVYMMFEQTESGSVPLKLRVLDMGLGMERVAWFSQGTPNMYEAMFPDVLKKLRKKLGVKFDLELYNKFSRFSAYLNADEVEDMDKAWADVAKKLGMKSDDLKEKILPMTGLYSIAEHSRALLVAIHDGALPSNVGGGYNLRNIFRRAQGFIDKFGWDVDMAEVAEWHAKELKPVFPELSENLDNTKKILEVEKEKYYASKEKAKHLLELALKKEINTEVLIELYDSNGIHPDLVKEEAAKLGIKIKIPDKFYALVAERHENVVPEHKTKKEIELPLSDVPATKAMYYGDWKTSKFKAKVLKVIDKNVILDLTYFYPTSGGQAHDVGTINGMKVVDIFKQGAVIIHTLDSALNFMKGETVSCEIDFIIRKQLTQNHKETHIINAAARYVLGVHINQAGAKKTVEKAHIDLTHYATLTDAEVKKIEEEANAIIKKKVPVLKDFMSRRDAEKKFGMAIYQGGAVPGNTLRIVNIENIDVEACGGTHLDNTSEAEIIKIIKTTKIQDGIVRIEFASGNSAKSLSSGKDEIAEQVAKLLGCRKEQIPGRAEELFTKWKDVVKKGKQIPFKLESTQVFEGDALARAAVILKTQPEHVAKTIERFISEIKEKS